MPPRIVVVQGSLTDGDETVLVNASNTEAQLGSGVSGAIFRACGREAYQQTLSAALAARGGSMHPGQVMVTGAGTHPSARHVVHVAVMDYRPGAKNAFPTLDTIRTGCEALWDAVEQLPASPLTVAMVALGGGTGNLGVRDPTRIACETLKSHLGIHRASKLERVTFYGFALHEVLAIGEVVKQHFPDAAVPPLPAQ